MQLFVRDASTLVVDAPGSATVHQLKELWSLKAFGVVSTASWMFVHDGRTLADGATLSEAGLASGAVLNAQLRLRGGGGDGGSTGAESRSCYLEMYASKKHDKVNPAEELLARWTRCHLSNEPLTEPVVADELGSLYNKEALVHALLNRTMPSALAHISSLKQLIALKLDPVPRRGLAANGAANGKGGAGAAHGGAPAAAADWQCPVTGLEMNGRARFVVHRPTGTVVSERALKEAAPAVEELFGGPWAASDLILINPTGDELQQAKEVLLAKLSAERAKKAAKKAAKRSAAGAEGEAAAVGVAEAAAGGGDAGAAERPPVPGAKRSAQEAAAAATGTGSAAVPAPAAAAAANGNKPASKKMKLPEGATPEVFKSIFHTAEQAAAVKETYACRAVSGRWRC